MVRLFHAYFPTRTLLLLASEAVLVSLGVLAAALASLNSRGLPLNPQDILLLVTIYSFVYLLCMYYFDLYEPSVLGSPWETKARLIQVLGASSIILAVLRYADPEIPLGGGALLLAVVLSGVLLLGLRELFFLVNRSFRLAEQAVLIGDGCLAATLQKEIKARPELGLCLAGQFSYSADNAELSSGLPWLGMPGDLTELVERKRIQRIIITLKDRRGQLPVELLLELKKSGVLIQDGADVFEAVTGKLPLDSVRVSWLLFSRGFHLSPAMRIYKRTFSIVFSLLGLLVSAPVMLLVAAVIRADSNGPVIFRQPRLGKGGKIFTLYKFRSMRHMLEGESKFNAAHDNDERFTRIGRWLRRTRLDELPQFYNILRGEMDFVGPRPFVPEQEFELMRQIPLYTQRLSIKPGATGWAQVNRGYCSTLEDNREKLAYDLYYIKNMSIGLDLLILFRTVKILLLGRGGR